MVEACSGLRYLFPLTTLALIGAYLFLDRTWKRIALIALSIPISVGLNVFRIAATGMLVNALAIAGYASLGIGSPIVVLAVLFAFQGAGTGVAMPAATAAVMDVLPRERAGAGSALTNTARQVAVALGVAVLGSILAQSYRSSLSPELAHLPASAGVHSLTR